MSSIRKIAVACGVSSATVSRALRNDPSVTEETRQRVQETARSLGYAKKSGIGEIMGTIRRSRSEAVKGTIGFIWVEDMRNWGPSRIMFESAVNRARSLGYSIDEFLLKNHRPAILRRILQARGIIGILFTPPSRITGRTHVRLPIEEFSAVTLGWAVAKPALHNARYDHYTAMATMLRHARHAFGAKIAAIADAVLDRRTDHNILASFLTHHPGGPAEAFPLFLHRSEAESRAKELLFRKLDIRCLIVLSDVFTPLPKWIEDRFPIRNRIYGIHPAPAGAWGYLETRPDLLGNWGVDLVVGSLMRYERGEPESQKIIMVPPRWRWGTGVPQGT